MRGREVYIAGTGSYLPANIITNKELSTVVGLTPEDIEKMTGIRERRRAQPDEATSDLATCAGLSALQAARIGTGDVDLVVVATTSPDMPFPSTACIVQKNIGTKGAFAFDINASCSGFLYALNIAEIFIKNGQADTALVIASEVKSRFVNREDKETAILFGDGAGAVVLQENREDRGIPDSGSPSTLGNSDFSRQFSDETYMSQRDTKDNENANPVTLNLFQGLNEMPKQVRHDNREVFSSENMICTRLYADGKNWKWIHLPAGGSRITATSSTIASGLHTMRMEGSKVYKAAIRTLEKMVVDIVKECGLKMEDIDHFIFHQANLRIIQQVIRRAGIPEEKVPLSLTFNGNTSSASIPVTLDQAIREGRISEGDLIVMASFGGGLTWGASVVRW